MFVCPPALQTTAPLSIDCSQPLSPAQTQTQNTPCQTEATLIGSDKKTQEKLSFFFVSLRSSMGRSSEVPRRPGRHRIEGLFGIFLLSLVCHILTRGLWESVFRVLRGEGPVALLPVSVNSFFGTQPHHSFMYYLLLLSSYNGMIE